MLRPLLKLLVPVFAGAIGATPAPASDLTIGIGADVTAIDPHYHNVTPNNNVAAHIFDYLVLRDERQKPIPGLAESWRTVDPLTWEFKLRKGVKFHDGSEFTAADVVASIERVPLVPNSPSPFTPYTKQITRIEVVGARVTFSSARNVRSMTAPVRTFLSLVRTKAPPLPGLTC